MLPTRAARGHQIHGLNPNHPANLHLKFSADPHSIGSFQMNAGVAQLVEQLIRNYIKIALFLGRFNLKIHQNGSK